MRSNDGKGRYQTGEQRRRWVALYLLLALGLLLSFGYTTSLSVYDHAAQIAHAGHDVEPCDRGHASGDERCHAPSACPFIAPIGAEATVSLAAAAPRPRKADQGAEGQIVAPGAHPPRSLLHA